MLNMTQQRSSKYLSSAHRYAHKPKYSKQILSFAVRLTTASPGS